ncbi:hypothetical protein HMPREF1575_00245 [Gardnerella vaginalis JCP7672]|nr:hypothetical protein HMPREF1575_00245 [Gardnerella vaginalis JCP7672]
MQYHVDNAAVIDLIITHRYLSFCYFYCYFSFIYVPNIGIQIFYF